jgi:Arm DNA-binding domain
VWVSADEGKPMLTDTKCRNLKPKAKPYKKSDGGGLRLVVQPGGSKLWRMSYRFGGRQKELAFGAYPAVTLAQARDKRDTAKKLLAQYPPVDPGVVKQEEKRERAAARPFGEWADEWLEKQRTEHDKKTMAGKDRYVGYLKEKFGKRMIPTITRAEVLLYLRTFEKTGRLETRDRVPSNRRADLHLRRRDRQRPQSIPHIREGTARRQ